MQYIALLIWIHRQPLTFVVLLQHVIDNLDQPIPIISLDGGQAALPMLIFFLFCLFGGKLLMFLLVQVHAPLRSCLFPTAHLVA